MKIALFLSLTSLGFMAFQLPFSIRESKIPDNVSKVFEHSCYDCHSDAAKNKDARNTLNLEKWSGYKLTKKISLLNDISEVIEEEKMPPEKYLSIKPEKKPSEAQRDSILEWVDKETAALLEKE